MIDPGGLSPYAVATRRFHPVSKEEPGNEARGFRLAVFGRDHPARGGLRPPWSALRSRSLERLALADAPPAHPSRAVRKAAAIDRGGAPGAAAGEREIFRRGH